MNCCRDWEYKSPHAFWVLIALMLASWILTVYFMRWLWDFMGNAIKWLN